MLKIQPLTTYLFHLEKIILKGKYEVHKSHLANYCDHIKNQNDKNNKQAKIQIPVGEKHFCCSKILHWEGLSPRF